MSRPATPDSDPAYPSPKLQALVRRLVALGPQSAAALDAFCGFAETPGLAACAVIKAPKNPKDHLEIQVQLSPQD